MDYALIKEHDYFAMRLNPTCSIVSGVAASTFSECISHYRKGTIGGDYTEGIRLRSVFDVATGAYDVEISVPELGLSWTNTSVASGNLEARLIGNIYCDDFNYYIFSPTIEAYHNGALVATWTPGDLVSGDLQPSAIPLIGIPPIPYCNSDVLFPLTDLVLYSTVVSNSTVGGCKWVVAGVDELYNVNIVNGTVPGCANAAPTLTNPTGTNWWSLTVTCSANVTVVAGSMDGDTSYAYVGAWPCLDRSLNRIGSDYGAEMELGYIPSTTKNQRSICRTITAGGLPTVTDTNNTVVVTPSHGPILPEIVDSSSNDFDDLYDDTVYTISLCAGWKIHRDYVGHALYNETSRYDEISLGADPLSPGYWSYLYSTNPIVIMWDYVMNPHWSNHLHIEDLPVQGLVNTDWVDNYYIPIRQQPMDIGTGLYRRNHFIADRPDCLQFWCESHLGRTYRNLGISRFFPYPVTYKTSYTYVAGDSALFSCSGGTLAFGANIVATANGGVTNIQVDLDTGSWTDNPHQWIAFCNEVQVGWVGTNISTIDWYLVGVDNRELALSATSGVWLDMPKGTSLGYAASAGIDNGNGIVYDTGTDIEPGGISAATMVDPERAGAFELLPGNTEYKLRAKIVLTGAGLACTLNYPQFRMNYADDPILTWESGQCFNMVFKNGPGIRMGNNDWTGNPPSTPPTTGGLGGNRSAVEGICDINELMKGRDRLTSLFVDLASFFDLVEAPTNLSYFTSTFMNIMPDPTYLDCVFILGNTKGQIPPLNLCPVKKRNTTTWDATGAFALELWSWIQDYNYYVTPGTTPMHLTGSSGTLSVIDTGFSLSEWNRTKAQPEVDNNEDGTANFLTYNTRKKLNVLPWHGYFGVFNPVASSETLHGYDVTISQNHYRLTSIDGKVYVGHSDNGLTGWIDFKPSFVDGVASTGIDITNGFLAVNNIGNEFIIIYVAYGGTIKRYISYDGGINLTSTTIATGNKDYPLCIVPEHNVEYVYYISGTGPYDVKGKIYDSQMNVLEAEFTVLSSANPLKIVGGRSWKVDNDSLRILLMVADSGTITQYVSSDGKNFS